MPSRSSRGPAASAWFSLLLLASCASSGSDGDSRPEPSAAELRLRTLRAAELAFEPIVSRTSEEVMAIRATFDREADALPLVSVLDVVDPVLELQGAEDRAGYVEAMQALGDRTVADLTRVLDAAEHDLWAVATEACRLDRGYDMGYRSGSRELDEMVLATLDVLGQRADRNGIQQKTLYRQTDRLTLQRVLLHDLEGQGRALLFLSEPRDVSVLTGAEPKRDASGFPRMMDAVEACVAFVPAVPNDDPHAYRARDLRWRQARRAVVRKAGVILSATSWELDRTEAGAGILPLLAPPANARSLVLAGYRVSEVETLVPNCIAADFESLRNHELLLEFRTGLEDASTGELLVSLSWQLKWSVDYRGQARLQPDSQNRRALEEDPVLASLARAELQ